MRSILVLSAVGLALAACQPVVPDSGAGVGQPGFLSDQERRAVAPAQVPAPAAGAGIAAAPLSDEQDFEAVAARETIESDRERLERLRAQYEVAEAVPLPERPDVGPSPVAFALATRHPVGVERYSRFLLRMSSPARNCAQFRSPDEAQEAFLAAGGPERDRLNLDPDGDGYACGWDPEPIRAAARPRPDPAPAPVPSAQ